MASTFNNPFGAPGSQFGGGGGYQGYGQAAPASTGNYDQGYGGSSSNWETNPLSEHEAPPPSYPPPSKSYNGTKERSGNAGFGSEVTPNPFQQQGPSSFGASGDVNGFGGAGGSTMSIAAIGAPGGGKSRGGKRWRKIFRSTCLGWFIFWGFFFIVAALGMATTKRLKCNKGTARRMLAASNNSTFCQNWKAKSFPKVEGYTQGLCQLKPLDADKLLDTDNPSGILSLKQVYTIKGVQNTCVDYGLFFFPTDPTSDLYVDTSTPKEFTMFRRHCINRTSNVQAEDLQGVALSDLNLAGLTGDAVSDLFNYTVASCVAKEVTIPLTRVASTDSCLPNGGTDLDKSFLEFGSCNIMFAWEFFIYQQAVSVSVDNAAANYNDYLTKCLGASGAAVTAPSTCHRLVRYKDWKNFFYGCAWLVEAGLIISAIGRITMWVQDRRARKRGTYEAEY